MAIDTHLASDRSLLEGISARIIAPKTIALGQDYRS